MEIFVDGLQMATTVVVDTDPGPSTAYTAPLVIAGSTINDVQTPDWAGDMDEFMVFATNPSPQQRKWIYDQLVAGNQPF
jgi:hypothetical protein